MPTCKMYQTTCPTLKNSGMQNLYIQYIYVISMHTYQVLLPMGDSLRFCYMYVVKLGVSTT